MHRFFLKIIRSREFEKLYSEFLSWQEIDWIVYLSKHPETQLLLEFPIIFELQSALYLKLFKGGKSTEIIWG